MPLLSLEELSKELSVPCDYLRELIDKKVIVPYAGRARLGEPRFSSRKLHELRTKLRNSTSASGR